MRKSIFVMLLTFLLSVLLSFFSVQADDVSRKAVTDIISGKQDKLIFASIVNVHNSVVTVDVTEEIGSASEVNKDNKEDNEDDEDGVQSIEGEEIDVVGLHSYMYYEGYDHHPKKGDNVLLSLTFNGNVYSVKNGAFRVSSASYDSFMFEVPEDVQDTDGVIELTALYKFVSSDGRNADYTIKNSAVYTHNTDGEVVVISEQSGINYIDAHGKTVQKNNPDTTTGNKTAINDSYKWIFAAIIIIVGMCSGVFVSKIIINFEKRSEQK